MVDKELYERYKAALNQNDKMARRSLAEVISVLRGREKEEQEELVKQMVATLSEVFGKRAAVVATEFYDALRLEEYPTETFELFVYEGMPQAEVGAHAHNLYKKHQSDTDGFSALRQDLEGLVTRSVLSYADDTLIGNARLDPRHPKYALVAHAGACGWCILISSNGFMYSSAQKVQNTRHASCKCTPVIDFDISNPKLEGYDPDAYQDIYAKASERAKEYARAAWGKMTDEQKARYKRNGHVSYDAYLRNCIVREINAATGHTKRKRATNATPQEFVQALVAAKKTLPKLISWRVDVHKEDDYEYCARHLGGKTSTYAVTPDGDIISVCAAKGDTARGRDLIEGAVRAGGIKLDSYDGNYGFYRKCGFEPVSWTKWDDAYAPEGWDSTRNDRENIIFFKYTGKKKRLTPKEEEAEMKSFYLSHKALNYDEAYKKRDEDIINGTTH